MATGPAPKHPSTRARRNRTAGARVLHLVERPKVPTIPKVRKWSPRAIDWWSRVWSSPMSSEFDESDIPGLVRVCELVDDVARLAAEEEDLLHGIDRKKLQPRDRIALVQQRTALVRLRVNLSSELRLAQASYGLTPIDRRRLQWEIDRGEGAQVRTSARRTATKPKAEKGPDPRLLLAN